MNKLMKRPALPSDEQDEPKPQPEMSRLETEMGIIGMALGMQEGN